MPEFLGGFKCLGAQDLTPRSLGDNLLLVSAVVFCSQCESSMDIGCDSLQVGYACDRNTSCNENWPVCLLLPFQIPCDFACASQNCPRSRLRYRSAVSPGHVKNNTPHSLGNTNSQRGFF